MGLRGPRKDLPHLARLKGNPGRRPIIDSGIEGSGAPFVPEHLCADARGCLEVIRSSLPPKVYAAADTFLLSAFAAAWALHKRAAQEVAAPDFQGVVRSTRGGRQPNPWIRIMTQQALLMAAIGDRLGLNPKARAALHVPEEKPPSKFDGLLGGERRFDA